MSDGQSEACEANRFSVKAEQRVVIAPFCASCAKSFFQWSCWKCGVMFERPAEKLFLEDCREKIIHKLPGLTSDEVRRLWEIAAGEKLPPLRKRCEKCDGDGTVKLDIAPLVAKDITCDACGGSGYVMECDR